LALALLLLLLLAPLLLFAAAGCAARPHQPVSPRSLGRQLRSPRGVHGPRAGVIGAVRASPLGEYLRPENFLNQDASGGNY
jgi:hypothetical protein